MKQFKLILSAVILIASIVIFAVNLLSSQTIQIVLDTGQEVATTSNYFGLTKVLVLVTTSFLIGGSITYLFYNSDKESFGIKKKDDEYSAIIPFLKSNEKKAMLALKDSKGEILQNKLVIDLGISKVKTARILSRLESKGLITKERYGLTNKIKFKRKEV